jgi:membrane-associated phospholipid phosphatase
VAVGAQAGARLVGLPRGLVSRVLVPVGLTWALVALPSRLLLGRPRVAEAAVLAPVPAAKPSAWSSPSAQTAATFAAARLLDSALPRWRPAVRIGALVFSLSRVYIGLHYASDVLVGGLCGWLLAPVVASLVERARGARAGRWAGR